MPKIRFKAKVHAEAAGAAGKAAAYDALRARLLALLAELTLEPQ